MRKVPWGILAGICAIVAFFAIVGTVAAFIILNGVAGQTNDTATLFDEWYQVVLFIVDIISVLGLVGSVTLYFIKAHGGFAAKEAKATE